MIRELKMDEYEKCKEIREMASPPQSEDFFEDFTSGNRMIYVYELDGKFIGEGALVYKNSDPDYTISNQRIYMSRLIVNENYRNQGIGGQIIDFLIKKAKLLWFTEIAIGVDKDNTTACHLYKKKGFTTILFEGEDEGGEYFKLMKK